MAPNRYLSTLAKDALYVTVGLGVIGFQKAQVQRRELRGRLKGQLDDAGKRVEGRLKTIEERLEGIETLVDTVLDRVEERLPEQARAASQQARTAARATRSQVRALGSRGAA